MKWCLAGFYYGVKRRTDEMKKDVAMNSRRQMLAESLVVLLLTFVPAVSEAAPWGDGGRHSRNMQEDFQPERRGEADDRSGGYRGGYYRRDDDRDMQHHRRLSPEERSQLRRDVRDAGREIYPPRRR
jgi:hypothetical protein